MRTPSELFATSAMRRKIIGWGGVAGLATVATYLGWNRSGPAPHASTPAVPARGVTSSVSNHAEPVAEAAQHPVDNTVFRREAFIPYLNTDFTVIHEGDNSAECRLIDVSDERRITGGKKTYTSFTLLFTAGPVFLRDGGICRVKHKEMREMQFFLSPVGKPGAKTMLEAAFTQAI